MADIKSSNNKSYWSLVWRQFKKRKIALYSLWVIIFFFFIGVFAPILANKTPIAIYTTYGEFYQYRFLSWKKNHENITASLSERQSILKLQKEEAKIFDELKKKIIELNKQKDEKSNSIEKFSNEIKEIESKYELNKDEKKRVRLLYTRLDKMKKENNNAEIEKIQNLIAAIEKKKKKSEVDEKLINKKKEERKKLRKELNIIKENKLKANNRKNEANIILIQCKNRLMYTNTYDIIIKSLEQMKFSVSDKIDSLIDDTIALYNIKLEEYGFKGFENLNDTAKVQEFIKELNTIYSNAVVKLDKDKIQSEYVMKLTFPVIESLTIPELIFMSVFFFIIFIPLLNWIHRKYFFQKFEKKNWFYLSYIGVLGIILIVFFLIKGDSISINYKNLFYDNFYGEKEHTLTADINKTLENNNGDSFVVFPLVPFGYNENNVEEKRQKPSQLKYISDEKYGRHILGTDITGRDVLSRMIWGARISLSVGFVAVSIYVFIGIIVGAFAGYFGGLIDIIISRIIEIVICFPSFFLILTIIAFIGPSIFNIMIVIGLTSWTGIARLVRGEFFKLRNLEYVTAAKALGLSDIKIIFKYILPNALTPVLVSATFGIASAILIEASLSFLGFGVKEPFPSWGQMISMGQKDVLNFWWLSLIPGFAIFISVTTYNLVGDALREAIDPRLKE